MTNRVVLMAVLLASCQIPFDLPNQQAGAAGGAGAQTQPGGGAAGDGAVPALLLEPMALWTFSGVGHPMVVPDRAGDVDLYPYPLALDQAVESDNGAVVLVGGSLKSDPGPATNLIRRLEGGREFSVETWAEMVAGAFQGKHYLLDVLGSERFKVAQTEGGVVFEIATSSTAEVGVVLLAPPGQLLHWVGTFSGSAKLVRVYLNGGDQVQGHDLTSDIAFPRTDQESRIQIGDQAWQGRVYEMAVYDRVLSADDVRRLYDAGWQR